MTFARACRLALLAALVALVGACSTAPTTPTVDSGPIGRTPDLSNLPDPVPRAEPRSKYGNKSPYEVLGKTYYVLPNPENYKEYGKASWYGTKFHGQRTSSGELYDMYKLTAAHRSLPIPSYVRVTNLDNHRTAIVRVNDRGPFHSERLIDLSYAAAVKLGFADRGTTRVMVELVDGTDQLPNVASSAAPRTPPPANALALVPPESEVPGLGQIFLQAGAFKDAAGAERLRTDLTELVGSSVYIQRLPNDGYYRVRIGPLEQMSEATRLQALIFGASHRKPLIVRE
ncbi:MAG TPA: septal ring lytic transglycosylase RlpA family protein [Pseudomonadales bacterium]|nr:septal ring lytic transglycosylase RlpA family protein [Pseudomonadales bacterium]